MTDLNEPWHCPHCTHQIMIARSQQAVMVFCATCQDQDHALRPMMRGEALTMKAKEADTSKTPRLIGVRVDYECIECIECSEETGGPTDICPVSARPCGHHCNHSWSHDACCWCNREFGEIDNEEGEGYEGSRAHIC